MSLNQRMGEMRGKGMAIGVNQAECSDLFQFTQGLDIQSSTWIDLYTTLACKHDSYTSPSLNLNCIECPSHEFTQNFSDVSLCAFLLKLINKRNWSRVTQSSDI